MLHASPLKASHQHKNLASFTEAQLFWLNPIPQTTAEDFPSRMNTQLREQLLPLNSSLSGEVW